MTCAGVFLTGVLLAAEDAVEAELLLLESSFSVLRDRFGEGAARKRSGRVSRVYVQLHATYS